MKKMIMLCLLFISIDGETSEKQLVYLVSDLRIPFWEIMSKGVTSKAKVYDYDVLVLSANNDAKQELENLVVAINMKADALIVSPTNSSAAVTLLNLAKQAQIPVVIADIGAESGDYLSYIKSNNLQGAYELGKMLAAKMERSSNDEGTVGIIAIPQMRENGQQRTQGFIAALDESGIDVNGLYQQEDFSYQETFDYTIEILTKNPKTRAIWLQGSNRYQAALDGIAKMGKEKEVLLICFDAEPEFLELLRTDVLVGAAMQQPFKIGERSVETVYDFWQGKKIESTQELRVLTVDKHTLSSQEEEIKRNVLGLD